MLIINLEDQSVSNELGQTILKNDKKTFIKLLNAEPVSLNDNDYLISLFTLKKLEDFKFFFEHIHDKKPFDLSMQTQVIGSQSESIINTTIPKSLLLMFLKYSRVNKIELLKYLWDKSSDSFKRTLYLNDIVYCYNMGKKTEVINLLTKQESSSLLKYNKSEMLCFHLYWFEQNENRKQFYDIIQDKNFDKYYVCKEQLKMLNNRDFGDSNNKMDVFIACFLSLLSEKELYDIYRQVKSEMKDSGTNYKTIDDNLGNFGRIMNERGNLYDIIHTEQKKMNNLLPSRI